MGTPTGIIGVIHVPAMPGDPRDAGGGFEATIAHAMRDIDALAAGGVQGLVIENYGSAPFRKGGRADPIAPHAVACLTRLAMHARDVFPGHIGVNCLRNDAQAAMGIAAACGLDFIRVNVHVGAYVTDQGILEGEAEHTLRYRHALGAQGVSILADVLVKHAKPLAPVLIGEVTEDNVKRGLADGIIVTGPATGTPVDLERLSDAREAAGDVPVFIGSGLTPRLLNPLGMYADGAIVGTYIKEGGHVHSAVDVDRVRELVEAAAHYWGP
ncbi:MAG: BtpA/SgcQ family protein [Myxococcota bacterium]